jgi:hypothetical protein
MEGTAAVRHSGMGSTPVERYDTDITDSVEINVTDSAELVLEDTMNVSHFFSNMPDTLLPYLSLNNRLDLIDFMNSGMKAVVTNKFDEQSEMTALTSDSLSLTLNPVRRLDMMLVNGRIEGGGEEMLICIRDTYCPNEEDHEQCLRFYSTQDWHPINSQSIHVADKRIGKEKQLKMFKFLDDTFKK